MSMPPWWRRTGSATSRAGAVELDQLAKQGFSRVRTHGFTTWVSKRLPACENCCGRTELTQVQSKKAEQMATGLEKVLIIETAFFILPAYVQSVVENLVIEQNERLQDGADSIWEPRLGDERNAMAPTLDYRFRKPVFQQLDVISDNYLYAWLKPLAIVMKQHK